MEIEGFQCYSSESPGDSTQTPLTHDESKEITLTQSDFMNSDALVQSLFIYVLQKSGVNQKEEGTYFICKHFQAEYSIGVNQSLIVRIETIDPNLGGCHKISCKSIVCVPETIQKKKSNFTQQNRNTQSTNQEKASTCLLSQTAYNNQLFYWISKLLEFYPEKFTPQEVQDINLTMSAAKSYLHTLHTQIKQIKNAFHRNETELQKICDKRLALMRKIAQEYVTANFEPNDFVSINYFTVDFNTEKQRMIEMEFSPGMLSLFGTYSAQFSSLLMRNKMQLCHKDTDISGLLFKCVKTLLFQNKENTIEFTIPNQRMVLIDRIVTGCDIQAVLMQNLWDKDASFCQNRLDIPYGSLDALVIKKLIISPDQIKQILEIRNSQQSLATVAQQETSMTYILQSENFFERFYPEEKIKLDRIEMDKEQKGKKMCNVKFIS